MPSVSKKQQKFMGLVHGIQKGTVKPSSVSNKAKNVAATMNKKDVTDFAKTSRSGLPNKANEVINQADNLKSTPNTSENASLEMQKKLAMKMNNIDERVSSVSVLRNLIKKEIKSVLNENSSPKNITIQSLREIISNEIDSICKGDNCDVVGAHDVNNPKKVSIVNWDEFETHGPNQELIMGPDESPKVISLLNYVKTQSPGVGAYDDVDVELNKILPGDAAKYKVYVKNPMDETVKKIQFNTR